MRVETWQRIHNYDKVVRDWYVAVEVVKVVPAAAAIVFVTEETMVAVLEQQLL